MSLCSRKNIPRLSLPETNGSSLCLITCSQYRKNVEKGYQYLRFAGGQQCWIPQHYADEIRKVPIKRRYLAEVRKENGRIKFLRVHTFAKDGTSAEFEIKYSYKNIPTDLADNKV